MRRLVPLVAVLALLAAGCRFDGLQFTADRRVEWVTEDRAVVGLPIELEWRLEGYEMVGRDGSAEPDAGYVAVFVDRTPQGPGEALEVLAEDDEGCRPDQGCPDAQWFADRGIYPVESGTSLVVDRLPGTAPERGAERRDITLVLLDGQGRRQGESAFRIRLEIDRERATAGAGS